MVVVTLIFWAIFYYLLEGQHFMWQIGSFLGEFIDPEYASYYGYAMQDTYVGPISLVLSVLVTFAIYKRDINMGDFGVEN